MNLVVPWCINYIKPIPKIIHRKLVNSWKETLALSNPRKSFTIINWKHQIGCLKMFRLPSVVFIFTKVASVACFCNITYNSSDIVVTCNTFFNASVIPKNVTVLNCHVNKVVCNPSVFCNRDFEKMRAINISHNNLENIPMGCFSSFSNLEWLTISNNAKLGLHNLFHAAYGIDRTKIKHIFASNINRVQVTIPFPRNISTLLTKTSLQTFHIAYNDIKTMEQGGIYFWPRTLLELSVRGNRFDLDYYML